MFTCKTFIIRQAGVSCPGGKKAPQKIPVVPATRFLFNLCACICGARLGMHCIPCLRFFDCFIPMPFSLFTFKNIFNIGKRLFYLFPFLILPFQKAYVCLRNTFCAFNNKLSHFLIGLRKFKFTHRLKNRIVYGTFQRFP